MSNGIDRMVLIHGASEAPLLTWLLRTNGRSNVTMRETFQWAESDESADWTKYKPTVPLVSANWGPKAMWMTAHVDVRNERDAIDRLADRLVDAPDVLPKYFPRITILLCGIAMNRRITEQIKCRIMANGLKLYGFVVLEVLCGDSRILVVCDPKMDGDERGLLFDPNHLQLRFMGTEKPSLDFGDLSSPIGIQCSAPTYRVSIGDIQRWQKWAEEVK